MKDYKHFLTRLFSLALILALLAGFQVQARSWAAQKAENQAAIQQVAAYNAQILAQQAEEDTQSEVADAKYIPGTYEGTGTGFGGEITLALTVTEQEITEITVISAPGEDASYFTMAQAVVEEMLSAQTAQVDSVSGATFSSNGLKEAAADALSKAVKA